jgi:undecaprenyl pyrophosphate synthase
MGSNGGSNTLLAAVSGSVCENRHGEIFIEKICHELIEHWLYDSMS